ncbi:MAG TPA: hypothetical protein VJ866_23055 [Pyrinomonadaceae bacterium]|nr:hypothetical protein [Pyrinomonadaceae bacterium]
MVDLFVIFLTLAALVVSFLLVWKIRGLKSRFIAERRQCVQHVLDAVGDIESLNEARSQAPVIAEAMERHKVAGLTIPLGSGERVSFCLDSSGLSIRSA